MWQLHANDCSSRQCVSCRVVIPKDAVSRHERGHLRAYNIYVRFIWYLTVTADDSAVDSHYTDSLDTSQWHSPCACLFNLQHHIDGNLHSTPADNILSIFAVTDYSDVASHSHSPPNPTRLARHRMTFGPRSDSHVCLRWPTEERRWRCTLHTAGRPSSSSVRYTRTGQAADTRPHTTNTRKRKQGVGLF